MRILYTVINGEITGGNIVCLKVIEEALRRGYEAIVNSPTEGKFTDILKEKNIKVYNFKTRRSFRFDSAFKLAWIIKKEGINLVHSHVPLGGTVLSCLAAWLAGVPVISHVHIYFAMNKNIFIRTYQLLLKEIAIGLFCNRIIAVSEAVKTRIIKQGVPQKKITVVYNGVDSNESGHSDNRARIRSEFGLKNNQYIIGEVGRISDDKGQHILIKAASKIVKEFPDAIFMIVGEDLLKKGEYRKKLEKLISDLGLRQNFIFTGYRADIMAFMDAFDIFVLPSLCEGLPVVILEAMTAKKAVIATAVDGSCELVVDGQTGSSIPAQDPDKLAASIKFHLENPEVTKKMGENGYIRAKQFFSLSDNLNKIMNLYDEVINERKQWL